MVGRLGSRKVAEGANLSYANLSYANLRAANLSDANLSYANLSYANLRAANLRAANLRAANLSDANLSYANLSYANLRAANLPAPTAVLLAYWGELTAQLCADLMLFDSLNHPDPEAFQRWVDGGNCPYASIHVQRAANFSEKKALWGQGQSCRPYDLMVRVLGEKCPQWSDEQIAAFEAKFKAKE
jgi:hypothetical protein